MTERELPAGRYGSRSGRKPPRWVFWTLLTVVLVTALVLAVVGYRNLGTQPIEARQAAFQVLDDHAVRITFEVSRDHPEQPADCIVRSRSADGDETGRKEVYVPAGGEIMTLSTVLRTSKRPVTGEVYGCSYHVPSYLPKEAPPRE